MSQTLSPRVYPERTKRCGGRGLVSRLVSPLLMCELKFLCREGAWLKVNIIYATIFLLLLLCLDARPSIADTTLSAKKSTRILKQFPYHSVSYHWVSVIFPGIISLSGGFSCSTWGGLFTCFSFSLPFPPLEAIVFVRCRVRC